MAGGGGGEGMVSAQGERGFLERAFINHESQATPNLPPCSSRRCLPLVLFLCPFHLYFGFARETTITPPFIIRRRAPVLSFCFRFSRTPLPPPVSLVVDVPRWNSPRITGQLTSRRAATWNKGDPEAIRRSPPRGTPWNDNGISSWLVRNSRISFEGVTYVCNLRIGK